MSLLLFAALVVAAPAPLKPPAPVKAKALATGALDKLLATEWRRAQVTPSAAADDATFLRRVSVDLIGVIPKPEDVRAFLADKRNDKRAVLVDKMLASDDHAKHLARVWGKLLMPGPDRNNVDRGELERWLAQVFAADEPFGDIAAKLVSATGLNTPGPKPDPVMPVNGAVNWLVRYGDKPQDLAGKSARIFLGVQIQCAQCHHHPYEPWTQDDFRRFTAAFMTARSRPADDEKGPMRRFVVEELGRPLPRYKNDPDLREMLTATPAALDRAILKNNGAGPRDSLGEWLKAPQNPWLARAIVNRVWAGLTGRGFVEPVDDFRASNPPAAPAVLEALAGDFVAGGFKLRRLERAIVLSRAYQLSSGVARGKSADRLWARYRVRPLDPDALLDSIFAATDVQTILQRVAGDQLPQKLRDLRRAVGFLFDVDEESAADDVYDGTIAQALMISNGLLVGAGASAAPGGSLSAVLAAEKDDGARIDALFLRTLSRLPTDAERARLTAFVGHRADVVDTGKPDKPNKAGGGKKNPSEAVIAGPAARVKGVGATPTTQAYEDVLWALLNSNEFYFRH